MHLYLHLRVQLIRGKERKQLMIHSLIHADIHEYKVETEVKRMHESMRGNISVGDFILA